MIVYRAAPTPTLRRLSAIVQDRFMLIHTMPLLSSAYLFAEMVVTGINTSYLSIAALSSSVWTDIRLVSHVTETRNPFHTLNGVNQYVVG